MVHEVVVVGGGIGGLTVAALLAARGVNVCLLERASQPGGVIARVESFGYAFDPGVGLYAFWEPGEIHHQVFSELPVSPPEVRLETSSYVVRLPNQNEIPLSANEPDFEAALLEAFPECGSRAIEFYRECALLSEKLRNTGTREIRRPGGRLLKRIKALRADSDRDSVVAATRQTVSQRLAETSFRFRRFIDVQLQLLAQTSSDSCPMARAAVALTVPRRATFSIRGGAPTVAEKLAESIKLSGGRIRYDTPVLRLSYGSDGRAHGVDLLSGETVAASRAVVSNLTVWDTYGKLIGLNRTPPEIRKRLTAMRSWGSYLIYLGMNSAAAERLSSDRILCLTDWLEAADFDPETSQLMLAAAPTWDPRAPEGKRAVTVLAFTDIEHWFTFHERTDELEEQDQTTLERVWQSLHRSIPELGDDIEVIDTVTPLACYDSTRRKLGMVGTTPSLLSDDLPHATSLENVFMVGDTNLSCASIAAVTRSALALANQLSL